MEIILVNKHWNETR